MWTVDSDTGQPADEVAEGGVVGDELDATGRQRVDRGDRVGLGPVRDLGVAEPDGEVGAALAGDDDLAAAQPFEVDVPEPGQVATVGFVGVPHGVEPPVRRMFQKNVGLAGGMAPVRRYLPELLELVMDGRIEPGLVFDATMSLDDVAEGYRAMDERRAIKVLIEP